MCRDSTSSSPLSSPTVTHSAFYPLLHARCFVSGFEGSIMALSLLKRPLEFVSIEHTPDEKTRSVALESPVVGWCIVVCHEHRATLASPGEGARA
jgi:hypothetical protein